jgi:hypothetical protein
MRPVVVGPAVVRPVVVSPVVALGRAVGPGPAVVRSGVTTRKPDPLAGLTGRPVLGVLPWLAGMWLDGEDSLALSAPGRSEPGPPAGRDVLRVAVVRLPRISNVTDVDALCCEPGVLVRFASRPEELADPESHRRAGAQRRAGLGGPQPGRAVRPLLGDQAAGRPGGAVQPGA